MTDEQRVIQFAQDVYMYRTGREFDDLEEDDGQTFLRLTRRWTNLFLDELKLELNNDAQPIDWYWARENDVNLGTVSGSDTQFELADEIERLVANVNRPLRILQDGTQVSHWQVVNPNQISNTRNSGDMVTVVNRKLIFSRPFRDTELQGTVTADVINKLPELTATDPELLDLIPNQLLALGVAKNVTLPDIVQGGLSPSYAQKYSELLGNAKALSEMSSQGDEYASDDLGFIGGVYGG